jgi:hypothetical protein
MKIYNLKGLEKAIVLEAPIIESTHYQFFLFSNLKYHI